MRLLIFLLALMSAFFVSADSLNEHYGPDLSDLRSPTGEFEYCVKTSVSTNTSNGAQGCDASQQQAKKFACESFASTYQYSSNPAEYTWGDARCVFESGGYNLRIDGTRHYSNGTNLAVSEFKSLYFSNFTNETVYECPPDDAPEYQMQVPSDQHSSGIMCAKPLKPEDCPGGYHSKAASKAIGGSGCVPKECPPIGSGENLYTSPNLGAEFSGGGMYCNDGCAYSVKSEGITSPKYAKGTSQGVACGEVPYETSKLADEGNEGSCSTTSNSENVSILNCNDPVAPTPEKEGHNNDDSKTDDTETEKKQKEICDPADTICNLQNLEKQVENSSNTQIDNDKDLHNKKIDADTKNTKAILNVMESVDTSILLQTSQKDRLHAVTVSKFNQLIDAVNGLETGGTGGGGGSGNGNGNGTGEGDCEGSASNCVPIEGAEIPQETINLDQYADKYDDWLPNAELPSEKCIVLTNGKSICLSFEAFILLFQGISGLLVIGALMHSAKIISGAI